MMNSMQNDFKEETPESNKKTKGAETPPRPGSFFTRWMNNLVQMGLGESLLRVGTNLFSILAIVAIILLAQAFYRQTPNPLSGNNGQVSGPTPTVIVAANPLPAADVPIMSGIARAAQIHTNVPSRPRDEITTYEVQKGDTINGIADKFGLNPKTIYAAN